MTVGLACLLLVLDLAALVLLRRKLRGKKSARTAVTIVCALIALALAGYLALTALFLDAAYHK
mgnify:FL=1